MCLVGPMDKATAYGAVDSGFESQAGLAKMSVHEEGVQSNPRDSSVGRAVDCRVFICFEHRHQLVGGSIPSREMHDSTSSQGARQGGLAQTVERCVRNAEVAGSIPASSTQTATLRGEYRVPSDPRSQTPSGPVSTIVGDQIGSPGAVCTHDFVRDTMAERSKAPV